MEDVPLKNGAKNCDQRFKHELGGNLLDFRVTYCSYLDSPAWSMDIIRDGTLLVAGAMLEPGCDVINNYRAGIGRMIFTGKPVTLDNLGVENQLTWVDGD